MGSIFRQQYRKRDGSKGLSRKWYGEYTDHAGRARRVALSPDKAAARALLAELERQSERRRAGILDASVESARTPLADLLELWLGDLALEGRSERHRADMRRLVRSVLEVCGWRAPADLGPDRLDLFLATLDAGPRTRASYRQAVVALANWLVRKRKLASNPLLLSTKPAGGARRRRRALSVDELRALVRAAADRPLNDELLIRRGPRKGLLERRISEAVRARCVRQGRHNALLYKIAFYTGLRASEIAALQAGDLALADGSPRLWLPAERTKGKRDALLPLRADLAAALAGWVESEGLAPADPLFRVSPFRTAAELRRDLAAAGIPYMDSRGRVADFHALRGALASHLNAGGTTPTTAKEILRHTDIRLTLDRYHDEQLNRPREAVEGLPAI